MGIIRKRLATSREPCSEAQSAQPTEADPAQPLDERASPAPVAHDAPRKTSKRASQITRPLVIVRIRSKPGQIKQVNETGAPDWSLSAGVAIVLFGFAIAFGTYATLTEREAVQSQLHRFAKHEEPRPAVQHERPSPTIPAVEMAQAPRSPVETPPVPASASSIAAIEARATREASAPSVIVVRSEPPAPARLSADASPPIPAKPPHGDAVATPAFVRQAPKSTQDVASATATHARTAPPAPKEHHTGPATAGTSLLASSQGSKTQPDEHVVREPLNARPPARTAAAAAAAPRATVASVSDTPAPAITPARAQTQAQTEAAVSLQAEVNKELFRRH